MHSEIGFDKLESVVAKSTHVPASGARLVIARTPSPFVPPTLRTSPPEETPPLRAEIIFIEASAAVGKSTMARYLSACRNIPLLDLASVPVSTGSLKSLVSDLSGAGDAVKAFHEGNVPIIVDALDEGRLLSGETGFESFLQTTGEFLLQDRSHATLPKLVFFGRHESIGDAKAALELAAPDVTTCSAEVSFFAEKAARELIDAYATELTTPDDAYQRHPQPAGVLIDAYFRAIAAALGLAPDQLWTDERGRAFAGYAPVLAALGSLLAEMDNFQEVTNRLRSEGRQEAWEVIEVVLDEILKRERNKLCDKLASQITVPIPSEAYDAHEQLTFIARRVHNLPRGMSTRVKLPGLDQTKYYAMVDQYLSDHPFVRQGKISNTVLGSLVLAHAVQHDLLKGVDLHILAALSRQPFLWRSLRRQMEETRGLELDGRYLGYVLNSFWNDPIVQEPTVVVETGEDGWATVVLALRNARELSLKVLPPVQFYAQLRNVRVQASDAITCEGHCSDGSQSAFYVYGANTIVCDTFKAATESMTFDGQLWLQAAAVESSPRLKLTLRKGAEVGWGGKVGETYPWSEIPSTVLPPPKEPADTFSALIAECATRLPQSRVLVVSDTYSFSESENQWAERRFPGKFPLLMTLLVKHGLANVEQFGTYAQTKYRVHMKTMWTELSSALANPTPPPALRAFLAEGRAILG